MFFDNSTQITRSEKLVSNLASKRGYKIMFKFNILRLFVLANTLLVGISITHAEDNWSSHYTIPNPTQKNVQLLQADLIKKGESDYYDNLGKTYIGQMNTNTYYQEGNFNNIDSTSNSNIDISSYNSKTSTIGSQNNSTTNITNTGQGVIDVTNNSESLGSQNGSIDIQ